MRVSSGFSALLILVLTGGLARGVAAQTPAPAASQAPQQDIDQLLGRALQMQQAGDLLGAVQAYEVVLQSEPNRADVRSNLGAAYIALGRFDDGMKEYKAAIASDPANPTYHFNLGLAYYKAGRHEEAAPEFAEVLKAAPGNQKALLLQADSLLQLDKDADVIALLSPHQNEFPTDLAFAYLLGMAMVRSGQVEQGQVFIDRIFKAGESAEGHLLMGIAYLNKQDYKAALPELSRAVEMNPKLPSARTLYGRALLGTGDQETASRQFSLALDLNPNDFEANLQMGNLRHREQRDEDAIVYLKRAIAIRPTELAVRHALAAAYLGQGQTDQARELLEAIVKEQPEFVDAHVLLATAYYRLKLKDQGDQQRAIVAQLNAANQAKQPGAKAADTPDPPATAPKGSTNQR
jgi:tetratricopeptide (TPR) repeat protein